MYDIVYVGIYDKRHNTFLPQICLRPSGFAWRLFCLVLDSQSKYFWCEEVFLNLFWEPETQGVVDFLGDSYPFLLQYREICCNMLI